MENSSFSARPHRLADAMKERTASLHRRAEQSGVIGAIFSGRVSRPMYGRFMRNLLPVYRALEAGLSQHAEKPRMLPLARREVFRASAIELDLAHLLGAGAVEQPLLPEGEAYVRRVVQAAEGGAPALLLAHAYTRFLGDLGGGPILKRRLATLFDLSGDGLAFYTFPEIADVGAFARDYRLALDAAGELASDVSNVMEEAVVAFHLNIALSEAVERAGVL